MNRLEGTIDAMLHLMDRQVMDIEGLMVFKCDDLELTERDHDLVVTALLVGAPVWIPRLGHWLYERWRRLGGAQEDRERPYRVDLADVEHLSQEIWLRHARTDVLRRQVPSEFAVRRGAGDLLGSEVRNVDGEHLGHVLDLRLEPTTDPDDRGMRVSAFVVGRGRPGGLLGYDRRDAQGPWLVRVLVGWLHRHSGLVESADVAGINWARRVVTITAPLRSLDAASTVGEPER
jgi:sporulation protein YlmC with PRC-barrel domain